MILIAYHILGQEDANIYNLLADDPWALPDLKTCCCRVWSTTFLSLKIPNQVYLQNCWSAFSLLLCFFKCHDCRLYQHQWMDVWRGCEFIQLLSSLSIAVESQVLRDSMVSDSNPFPYFGWAHWPPGRCTTLHGRPFQPGVRLLSFIPAYSISWVTFWLFSCLVRRVSRLKYQQGTELNILFCFRDLSHFIPW